MSAMQGCWLAIDEQNQLNLCYVQPIEQTDEQHFSDTLAGFIGQVKDVRAFTSALL
ncbi:CesT family type III secretion system chaperone [Vibrio sp. PP-XX7]